MGIQEIISSVGSTQASTSTTASATRLRARSEPQSGRALPQGAYDRSSTANRSSAPNRDEVEARVEQAMGRFASSAEDSEVQDLGAPLSDDEKVEASNARRRNLVSSYSKIDERLNQLSG